MSHWETYRLSSPEWQKVCGYKTPPANNFGLLDVEVGSQEATPPVSPQSVPRQFMNLIWNLGKSWRERTLNTTTHSKGEPSLQEKLVVPAICCSPTGFFQQVARANTTGFCKTIRQIFRTMPLLKPSATRRGLIKGTRTNTPCFLMPAAAYDD